MADPRTALELLRSHDAQVRRVCSRHGVELLTAFGSALLPDGSPHDLDLAVRFERPHSAADPLQLLDDLAHIAQTTRLDLMDLNRAGPVARERALVGAIVLFEAAPGTHANAAIAATLERMDTAWLRLLSLEAMSR